MKQENLRDIIQLRHELHAHPELSAQEVWTRQHLIDFLRKRTSLEIVEQKRWFYAIYHCGCDARTIAFRADFDALPMEERLSELPYASQCDGVAHKCGHDGHAAALAGLALEIDQNGCNKNVVFLFQHAEETGEGASECVDTLSRLGIDEIYAFHNMPGYPKNSVIIRSGTIQCASVGMTVEMVGTPTHASTPELGRNPANAIARLACALPELSDSARYTGLVLCTVIQIDVGQKAFGMSASRGEISITIRAEHEAELDCLLGQVEGLARELSQANGLICHISYTDCFPETRNTLACADRVRIAARALGLSIIDLEAPVRASEDFGTILKAIPGAAFQIGNGEDCAGLHSYEYDFPDEILETAVQMYQMLLQKEIRT